MQAKSVFLFLAFHLVTVSGASPEPHDVCHQPKVVGPCRALKPRFWYNAQSGKCDQFFYGGCSGNENNFFHEADCVAACAGNADAATSKSVQRTGDHTCHQPQVVGVCRAAIPRFWYNDQTQKCEHFLYGGCGGNDNNFEKESECVRVCKEGGHRGTTTPTPTTARPVQRSHDDICSFPQVVGHCRALLPRFWYNAQTQRCEGFFYGGCDGNANNFKRESECIAMCVEGEATDRASTKKVQVPQDEQEHTKKHDENGAFLCKSCLTLIFSTALFHLLLRLAW